MSQSTHRFVLEMDAEQAKRVAKEFRQMIESELRNLGGSGSPLAATQKTAEQISKTEMFGDATKRAEQLENTMRRIRDLSAQIQNMDVRFEPNTARWNAQVEEFYKKLEQAQGSQAASLARGRNVIPSVGAVGAEFAPDTSPVEEWSVKALRTAEEVKQMSNEYNRVFAELSQAQAERIRLEREGIEEEIRAVENYISSSDDDGTMLQRLYELAETKDRMVKEEAQELAAYQRAMQEYITNDRASIQSDGPETATRLTVSKQTVQNMEKLAALLQQAEGFQRSIADSTDRQAQSISAELSERRQLLEAEYQGRIKILEAERQTLQVTEQQKQEQAQQAADQRLSLTTAQTELALAKALVKEEEKQTAEIEQQTQELKRQTAEANKAIADTNLQNQQVRTEGLAYAADAAESRAQAAASAAEKQRERNHLEVERRMTAITEAESKERSEAATRETIDRRTEKGKELVSHREAEERMTAITREEARRQTALYVQELRERNREQERSFSGLSNFLRTAGQDLVLGGLGLYGADQVLQRGYDFAKEGAQQLRTMETFANLSRSIGADADEMLESIQRASRGTISEYNSMSYASQVFALKFAKDVEDIDGDMEVIMRGARRFSQIFTDEFGKALSIEEIFSRLLKYVREGNKELVDQFGITNQGIADALGIPNEGLRDSEGAINRWAGLVAVIEEQLGRLGEATDSTADRFERAEARISDAINRLRQASAEPIAVVVEVVADAAEYVVGTADIANMVQTSANNTKQQFENTAANIMLSGEAYDIPREKLKRYYDDIEKLQDKVNDLRVEFSKELQIDVVTNDIGITEAQERIEEFTIVADEVGKTFAEASNLAMNGMLSESAYANAVSSLGEILQSLREGNIEYETAEFMIGVINSGLQSTTLELGDATHEAWNLAEALAAAANMRAAGQAEEERLAEALKNPTLAYLNEIGATGTSMRTENYGQKFLRLRAAQQARDETWNLSRVRQQVAAYDFDRLSPADQQAALRNQRQSLIDSGAPQSEIEAVAFDLRKLTDTLNDQGIANAEQADAIRAQGAYDLLSTEEKLAFRQSQLQSDTLGDVDRANYEVEVARLQKELAETRADERAKRDKERAQGFVDETSQRIQNFRTYEDQLNYLGSVALQSQGTLAEEGINNLISEVLEKQGRLDEERWENLFDNSSFVIQQKLLLDKIEQTNDENERFNLQQRLTDLLEAEDTRITQEEQRAAKDAESLADKKRQADLAGLDDAGQLAYLKDYISTLQEGTEEYEDAREDINRLERRLAEEGSRASTAAFEKAAKDMAKSFEEELAKAMNIPGVLSPSEVTEQDMIDTKYGLYRDNPDEWLRRAKDELLNGVDRPDVDPGAIAAMLGIDGGLPNEVLYGRLESAWSNQSLFADPANLGLLNTDAIMSRYMDIKQGEIGRQNLEDYIAQTLQISIGEASAIAGTQSPLIQQITGGQSGAEIASQLSSIQQDVLSNLDTGFVETIASGWQKDIDQNIAKLDPLADAMADRINSRLTEKLGEITGLIDSVAARVLELISDDEEA